MTLLGVLALRCCGAYAVFAAGGKADFSIAASPSSQTVTPGSGDDVLGDGHAGRTGSPGRSRSARAACRAGATASWKLSDGTTSNVVPPNLNSATLTIQTASTTPNGTSQPLITATSGKLTQHDHRHAGRPARGAAELHARRRPRRPRRCVQGDQASYSGDVNRTGGFSGAVSLSVSGPPEGRDRVLEPEQHGLGREPRARRCRSRPRATPRRTPTQLHDHRHRHGQRKHRLAIRRRDADRPEEPELPDRRRSRRRSSSPGRKAPLDLLAHQPLATSTSRSRTSRSRSRRARASPAAAARRTSRSRRFRRLGIRSRCRRARRRRSPSSASPTPTSRRSRC